MQKFYDALTTETSDLTKAWQKQAAQLPLEQAQAVGNTLAEWQTWWAEK